MDFNRPRQDNFSSSAENSINRRSSSSSSSNNNNINSNNNNNNNIFNKQSNNFKQSPTGGRCNSDPKTICSRNDSYDTNAGSSADNNKCSSPTEGVNNKITTSGGPSTPNAGDDPETKEPLKYISEDSGGIVSSVKCQDNNVSGNEHEILYNDFVNHLCPLPNDREHFQQNNNCSSGIASETDSLLPSAQKSMINSEVIDENTEDVKPLLVFEHQNEKKRPKSIVKSPSAQSFNSDQSVRARNRGNQRQRLSLQCPTTATAETERPVLHVQFLQHENDGSPSSICSDEDDKKDICSSPIGSISSSSSSDSSSSSSSSSSDEEYSEARPPDGGWGWVIVFASFMVNLIADGITFSFGVIFVEFLNYFGEGKAKTAWIGSLFMAMPLLSGPIASFLTDRYGCRKVTVAGSILASTGFVISAFSNSMEMLFFTFGILAGFGLSLCYVAAVVIVAYYFDKKRSFATGLSVCGSGIGTFIFAPITQILLEEYGWRGTTLILAGAFLNMTVCGMLMRDLEWTTHKAKSKAKEKKGKNNKMGVSADSFSVSNSTNTGGTASNLQQPIGGTGSSHDDLRNSDSKIEDPDDPRLFSSLITLPTFVRNGEKVPPEVLELLSTHRNVLLLQNYPGLLHSRSFSEPLSSRNGLSPEGTVSPSNKVHSPNDVGYHASRPNHAPTNEQALLAILKRNENHQARDKPTAAYLKDLRMHRHSLTYRGAMLNINRYRLRASSCPDIYRNSMTTIAKEKTQWYQGIDEFKNLFLDILDFSHFADMRFLLFALSNFLLYTWYDVPYVYLADNAIGMGFSETDASVLISIIGIVNMFGEIGLGWIGDRKWINPTLVYALCMALCGAVIALVPLFKTYTALSAISGAFGLFIAANYSLTSIILVELITIERFTNAYGLLLLVQGIANLVGPPLAGWVYDKTGNYDLSFYLAGFFIAISGGLLVVLPALGKYRKYRALKRQNSGTRSEKDPVNSMDCSSSKSNGTTLLSDCFGKDLIKDNVRMNHV